jgi:hypothetical protein
LRWSSSNLDPYSALNEPATRRKFQKESGRENSPCAFRLGSSIAGAHKEKSPAKPDQGNIVAEETASHDVEDWLEAEAEIDGTTERAAA